MRALPSIRVAIEVSVNEVFNGVTEIIGTLAYKEDGLDFSYHTKNLMGQVADYGESFISLDKIQEVVFKKGMVTTKLILRPKRLDIMQEIPGEDREKIVFSVKRADRDEAETLATFLQRRLHEIDATEAGSVPFQLPDTNMGFTENSGLMYLEDEFLVFDINSGLQGITQNDSQIVKIEVQALAAVRRVHGTMKDTLFIKPKKSQLLQVMPGEHETEVKLKVPKEHREALDQLIEQIDAAWGS